MNLAFAAIVLHDPHNRLIRVIPELRQAAHDLESWGLFEPGAQQTAFTRKGFIANVIARESNPLRAYYRTTDQLARRVLYSAFFPDTDLDVATLTATQILHDLHGMGIITSDRFYKQAAAWRLSACSEAPR